MANNDASGTTSTPSTPSTANTRKPQATSVGLGISSNGSKVNLQSLAGLTELSDRLSSALNTVRADGSRLEVAGEEGAPPRCPARRRDDLPITRAPRRPRVPAHIKKWARDLYKYMYKPAPYTRQEMYDREVAAIAEVEEVLRGWRVERRKSSDSVKTAYGPGEEVPVSAYRSRWAECLDFVQNGQ